MLVKLVQRPAPILRVLSLIASIGISAFALYDAFQARAQIGGLPPFPHYDKVVHIVAYFGLATVSCHGLAIFPRLNPAMKVWRGIGLVWVGVSVFGALCEVAQYLAGQGRVGDPLDALANSIGAFLACLLFLWLQSVEYREDKRSK